MKQCNLCTSNTKNIDYKDVELLSRLLTPQKRILSKKRSLLCARHQRRLAQAVKRSRFMALIPFTDR